MYRAYNTASHHAVEAQDELPASISGIFQGFLQDSLGISGFFSLFLLSNVQIFRDFQRLLGIS